MSKQSKMRRLTYKREDLDSAVVDIRKGMPINTAAIKYNIPRTTLYNKVHSKYADKKPGPNTILTADEENCLVNWIIDLSERGKRQRESKEKLPSVLSSKQYQAYCLEKERKKQEAERQALEKKLRAQEKKLETEEKKRRAQEQVEIKKRIKVEKMEEIQKQKEISKAKKEHDRIEKQEKKEKEREARAINKQKLKKIVPTINVKL